MKHRFWSILICCVLMFSDSVSAHAVGAEEYTLDDLGMTVSMPSDYIVFTRDIDDNDPNLDAYGLTKDGLSSLMHEQNTYLDGWDENINQEVFVTMVDSPLADLNLYSNTTLTTFATSFEDEYKNVGITMIKSELYRHSQAKFLKIYTSQPSGDATVYGLQYYTIYANKAINITMKSYSGQITSENEALLKSIVDSAIFDVAPQTTGSNFTPTSSFTYTDSKTRTFFTVPANWVEMPSSEDREFIDVEFTSLAEEGLSILYGSYDVWSELTASERGGYSRADADNSMLTKSDIADMYGLSSSDVSVVTVGGKEYYKTTVTADTKVSGLKISITMTRMIFMKNGYMYSFQFNGSSDSAYYKDFEFLLSSVTYTNQDKEIRSVNNTDTGPMSMFSFTNILFSLLVTVTVYSLPIIIYRYAIRKVPMDKKNAKIITIIYGICAFVIMSVIIFTINGSGTAGSAIVLWSYINYRILIGGKRPGDKSPEIPMQDADTVAPEPTSKPENAEHSESVPLKTEIRYCHKCGNKLQSNSLFCNDCGAEIPQ